MAATHHDEVLVATVPDLHYPAITAHADRLPAFRRILNSWATSLGMVAEKVHALTSASYEAMANVVAHAYRGRPGLLEMHAVRRAGEVTVTVVDHGNWRPAVVGDTDPLRSGGRGVLLIRALAERVVIKSDGTGTTVRMSWSIA
jgi:serine/threonine-protein kinase RsbW